MTIEKLAFKEFYELKDTPKIDLLLVIEFLQKDRKQWINQYSTAHNDYVELKEIEKEHQRINGELRVENKELQDRIDKAVEYATKEMRIVNDNEYHRLIEILKGDKE